MGQNPGGGGKRARALKFLVFSLIDEVRTAPLKAALDREQTRNYVLFTFFGDWPVGWAEARKASVMFRAVVEEAAALASLSLFLGMIAIWAQVLGSL